MPREFGSGMRDGKFLEAALLGRPHQFESNLPIKEAINEGKLASLLRENMQELMQQTRDNQTDDPGYPKRPFMRKLLNDVEDKLASRFDLPASYEVRVYSTVDTILDAGGIDFWIELYDSDRNTVVSDFRVDLKSNPHGRAGKMADYLYFYDNKIDSDDPKAIYDAPDYKDLVESTAAHLSQAMKARHVRGTRRDIDRLQIQGNFS